MARTCTKMLAKGLTHPHMGAHGCRMTSQTSRATRTGLAALGVALLSALAAGCSSAGTVTVEQAPPPAPAIQAGARPQAGADAVTTAKGTPDRLAPSTYRPVIRNGRAPHPSIAPKTGNAGALRSVAYKDGVTVTVTRVTQGVETGRAQVSSPGGRTPPSR